MSDNNETIPMPAFVNMTQEELPGMLPLMNLPDEVARAVHILAKWQGEARGNAFAVMFVHGNRRAAYVTGGMCIHGASVLAAIAARAVPPCEGDI